MAPRWTAATFPWTAVQLPAGTGPADATAVGIRQDIARTWALSPSPSPAQLTAWLPICIARVRPLLASEPLPTTPPSAAPPFQMVERAHRLTSASGWPQDLDRCLELAPRQPTTTPAVPPVVTVSTVSALQAQVHSHCVIVLRGPLAWDQPLRITGIDDLTIDAGDVPPTSMPDPGEPAMIVVHHARQVHLRGFRCRSGGGTLLHAVDCIGLTVEDCHVQGMRHAIIVDGPAQDVVIRGIEALGTQGTGIGVSGPVEGLSIVGCHVAHGSGSSDFAAGILLTARQDISSTDGEHWQPPVDLAHRPEGPHDVFVGANVVEGMRSSGIYADGVHDCFIIANSLRENAKEGMCLDFGCFGNAVVANGIIANGRRGGMSDGDLAADSVLGWGRLPDGSSAAKLPGLSLDNAWHNRVIANVVADNAGSGIKMVRTGIMN